jgi:hypothetical protein
MVADMLELGLLGAVELRWHHRGFDTLGS